MLRHGCSYYLANISYNLRIIQDYLGHKNVQNTVIYTRLSGKQFEGIWKLKQSVSFYYKLKPRP